MTLFRTQSRHEPNAGARAFTVIELILVIALVGAIASLVVINIDNLFERADEVPVESLLAMAVKEARYRATIEKEMVHLNYNPETAAFEVMSNSGYLVAQIPTDFEPGKDELTVEFFAILPGEGRPLGRIDPNDVELQEISRVAFDALLVSPPFVTRMEYGGYEVAFRFDPFSNVQFPFQMP